MHAFVLRWEMVLVLQDKHDKVNESKSKTKRRSQIRINVWEMRIFTCSIYKMEVWVRVKNQTTKSSEVWKFPVKWLPQHPPWIVKRKCTVLWWFLLPYTSCHLVVLSIYIYNAPLLFSFHSTFLLLKYLFEMTQHYPVNWLKNALQRKKNG